MESAHADTWQNLLDRLHGGETAFQQARSELIEHACARLEKLTRRMLSNYPRLRRWEQTGDVLQNALVRLHRALESVQPESAAQFFGLAATQIRRELIDLSRHHFGPQGAAANHHSDGALADQAAFAGEPITLAEWTEFHEQVERLPEPERHVFHLLWYEGLSQIEVARLLGVTDRTIKNRWRSAKLHLQELLG